MIEGALHQTMEKRFQSSDTHQYDVRALLKKIEESNSVDTTSWKGLDEDKLTIIRQQIESEFPQEVADIIVKVTRERSKAFQWNVSVFLLWRFIVYRLIGLHCYWMEQWLFTPRGWNYLLYI